MSYDPKYNEWIEKISKIETAKTGESSKVYQVYKGIPIIRTKIKDNPPQYQFIAPVARAKDLDGLREKIDQRLDKTTSRTSRASRKEAEKDETTYFQKWQDCQIELEDLKRRETNMLSKVEELQTKADQLSLEQSRLRKEAADLRNQLKASEELIRDLKKKNS